MLRELLDHPHTEEVCELRGRFGLMAFHGGNLERTTDTIASEVARRCRGSYYAVIQHPPLREHVPSIHFDPDQSPTLARFLAHVETVVAIHGYGRDDTFWDLLLGGRNRALALHLATPLRERLDARFGVVTDVGSMPRELRGVHARNPVNRPPNQGVQLELPPPVRWNSEANGWSDHDGTARAPQVDDVIGALVDGIESWTQGASRSIDQVPSSRR